MGTVLFALVLNGMFNPSGCCSVGPSAFFFACSRNLVQAETQDFFCLFAQYIVQPILGTVLYRETSTRWWRPNGCQGVLHPYSMLNPGHSWNGRLGLIWRQSSPQMGGVFLGGGLDFPSFGTVPARQLGVPIWTCPAQTA